MAALTFEAHSVIGSTVANPVGRGCRARDGSIVTQYLGILEAAGEGRAAAMLEMAASAREGGKAMRRWSDAAAAIAQAGAPMTPEALPLASPAGHIIAGDIRLDNRTSLLEALGVPYPERAAMSDAALVLAAYARWGLECIGRLLGDFAFAIWDPAQRRLACAVDHFAMRQLYYRWEDGRFFIFSSHPRLMLAVPGVPMEPDFDLLAGVVDPEAVRAFPGATFFAGVRTLPGGTLLTVDANGIREHRYWEPALGTPLRFRDDGEFREAFQHHFFEAVRCRLRSGTPVTAMLSGGLDSSAIVAAAARLLEKENRSIDVLSVVLPEGHDPRLSDEREYIDLFKRFPNVRINYLDLEGRGPFGALDSFDWSFGPFRTSRQYNYDAMVERCVALGSRVLLDGGMGELGASFHGQGHLAELFRTLRWPRLWRELKAAKKTSGAAILPSIRSNVVRPLAPAWLVRAVQRRSDVNIGGMGIFAPEFVAAMRQRIATSPEKALRPFGDKPSLRRNQLDFVRLYRLRGGIRMLFGAPIDQRFPLMDVRLIQFCLDAPSSFKVRDGYSRNLIRLGMEGVLPPEIQWRTTKGPFSPDYMPRYNAEVGIARALLEAIGPGDPVRSVIDVDTVLALARLDIADDERDPYKIQAAMHRVPTAIHIISYLRQFGAFRP